MMSPQTTLSVIIPFYREFDLIDRAIASVLAQTRPANMTLEVIIGNDSGLPEKRIRSVLSEASSRATQIVANSRESGAGNARNAALDAASGELIAFLDADDYWLPGKLMRQIRLVEAGANFVAGAYHFEHKCHIVQPPKDVSSIADSLRKLGVGTSTVLLRRSLLGTSRFRNLRFSQDTELWARLAGKPGFAYAATSDAVTVYAPSGRTANKFLQLLAFAKVVRTFRLSLLERAGIYLRYTARGLLNHYVKR